MKPTQYPNGFAVRVTQDIYGLAVPDDILIINPDDRELRAGKYYMVEDGGSRFIRRYCPEAASICLEAQFERLSVIGRVVSIQVPSENFDKHRQDVTPVRLEMEKLLKQPATVGG